MHSKCEFTIAGRDIKGTGCVENATRVVLLNADDQFSVTAALDDMNLHPLALEDMLHPAGETRISIFDHYLVLSLVAVQLNGENISYMPISIAATRTKVIVVQSGPVFSPETFQHRLLNSIRSFDATGFVVHGVLDLTVSTFGELVSEAEDRILAAEKRALEGDFGKNDSVSLFPLRRQLILLQRILDPMADEISKIDSIQDIEFMAGSLPYFRDTRYGIQKLERAVDGLWSMVSSVFEVSNLLTSQRQNDISRKLAAWAAIIAVPTAISGIYGMNFNNLPGMTLGYGYLLIIGLMAGVSVVLYVVFRKTGWL